MALITCPDCGKEFSDQAAACPNCGRPNKAVGQSAEQPQIQPQPQPPKEGKPKKFKALTEKGLKYGENAVSPHNQKEVQPLYYADSFMELFDKVNK